MTPRLNYKGLSDVGGNLARQNDEIFAEHLMDCVKAGLSQKNAAEVLAGTFKDAAYLEMEYAEEICPKAMLGMVELGHSDYVETFAHFDGRAFVQTNWDSFKAAHESAGRPHTRPPTPVERARAAGKSNCTKPKSKPESKATSKFGAKKTASQQRKPSQNRNAKGRSMSKAEGGTQMSRYYLVNSDRCHFDDGTFPSDNAAIEWARGRGGNYTLYRDDGGAYRDELVARWRNGRKVPDGMLYGSNNVPTMPKPKTKPKAVSKQRKSRTNGRRR